MSHELTKLTMIDRDASVHKHGPWDGFRKLSETIAGSRNATAQNETDELRQ